ncbi:MAG: hypothetical protein ACPGFK_04630 [Flavobacteriaceae bacterium]
MKIFLLFLIFVSVSACQTENTSNKTNIAKGETEINVVERYDLPKILEETSGLAIRNDTLWTLNDSGNEATLYAISSTGALVDSRETTRTNIDWEDMATANGNLIVADMGNNFGTRKNLYLLEIDLNNGGATTLDSIPFHYPEQENFGYQQATPFDAEGVIFIEDQLVVFTKNRSTQTTEIYTVSKTSEAAKKIGSLRVGSLITGADYHQESNTLALTGYGKNKIQYLYVINNFTLSTISSASINQYDLHLNEAQVEAVAILDPKTFWITSEETTKYNAFLAKAIIP